MAKLIEDPEVSEMVRRREVGVVDRGADDWCVPWIGAPGTAWTVVVTMTPLSFTLPQFVTVAWAEIRVVGGNMVAGGEAGRVPGLEQPSPTVLDPPVVAMAGGDSPAAEMSS